MTDSVIRLKINVIKLIKLVRGHEILYNHLAPLYNNKKVKMSVWDKVHEGLFPGFYSMDESMRESIRINVRRRWKALRDSVSREIKKSATVENYIRKKQNAVLSELEFLIPHMRSTHCINLSEELGLRECCSFINANDDQRLQETNSTSDFTDQKDFKSESEMINTIQSTSVYSKHINEIFEDHLYPEVHIKTNLQNSLTEARNLNKTSHNWCNDYCTVAEFKGGEFTNSIVLCTNQEYNEILDRKRKSKSLSDSSDSINEKRICYESDSDTSQLHLKILNLCNSLEKSERSLRIQYEGDDEDRMFLLSLVSDLKRVPAHKKMLVKAEIVTTIARSFH